MPYINTIDINGEVYHVANLTDGEHVVNLPLLNNDDTFLLRGDVIDGLTSALVGKPLSANQGKILNEKIDTAITTFQNTVVHYTAENKTDTQKTQARANIGAEAAPVELTWSQETYPNVLDFLRTIESPGRYTFADDSGKYCYTLTRAHYDGSWTWYGILVNFSGEENNIETTVYTGSDVGVLSPDNYLAPITRGVLNNRVPETMPADAGKVLTVGAGGRPAWTAVTNAEEVAY